MINTLSNSNMDSQGNFISSGLAASLGNEIAEQPNEKYHLVGTTVTNDLIIKKEVTTKYKWALVFFGLSALLPNAAILTDMDYFIKQVRRSFLITIAKRSSS